LLVRNLLLSAQTSMQCLSGHLDRIEAADGETVSLLRYYLEDSAATVLDAMALGRILGPRIGETSGQVCYGGSRRQGSRKIHSR